MYNFVSMKEEVDIQYYCMYCFAEGVSTPATRFQYNYADKLMLPLCDKCAEEEENTPTGIFFYKN